MIDPPRRIAAALTGAGVALCVLGWYQIAGQPTVPQQLPYLASATIPGAALLGSGLVLLLRAPLTRGVPRPGGRAPNGPSGARTAAPAREGLWRVPDGRYLHTADCPLLDGRTDLAAADGKDAAGGPEGGLRPCPLCRAAADPGR
jgi:hypothetical protein